MVGIKLRTETIVDSEAINDVIIEAFKNHPIS